MSTEDADHDSEKAWHPYAERGAGRKRNNGGSAGMKGEDIEKVVDPIDGVTIANYNCPGQIVITGWKESVEKASEELKAAGAKRVLPLNVSGPFHSPMLEEAGRELGQVLAGVQLSPLEIPYVTNVTAEIRDGYFRDKSASGKTGSIICALAAECGEYDR